jgi:asparagine synthase (glutamine-hydrolysing)
MPSDRQQDPPSPLYLRLRVVAGDLLRVRADGSARAHTGDPDRRGPGPWASWEWDGRALRVAADRYGLPGLFHAAVPGGVVVSTDLGCLLSLGVSAELDDDALAVFLRLGIFVGDDTPLRAVRAVPPGARLVWTPDRAGEGLRWADGHGPRLAVPEPLDLTREQAVDACIEGFRSAVAAALPQDEYALPLSGGRDSRHLLLELLRQGAAPRVTATTGKFTRSDADVRIAAQVAAALQVPHVYVPRVRSELRADLVSGRLQQHSTVEGSWMLPIARFVRAHGRVGYDGLGGDALWQTPFHYYPPVPPAARTQLRTPDGIAAWLVSATGLEQLLPRCLGHAALRRWSTQRALARISAEMARHTEAAVPLASFRFWNRTRRAIACHAVLLTGRNGFRVHLPYLNHELFDLTAGLPERVFAGGCFHTEVIRRAYPFAACLPFVEGPMRHGPRVTAARILYLADLAAYTARRETRHWMSTDGPLGGLLRGRGGLPSWRPVDRLVPYAVYLLQLRDLINASRSQGGPRGDTS